MNELEDRAALVTGGSRGIGRAIVTALAQAGANVTAAARGGEALDALESDLHDAPGAVQTLSLDAIEPDAAQQAVAATLDRFGRLDILVNNVGGPTKVGTFADLTRDDWRRTFELNVLTVVDFVQAALPSLRRSPAARVINLGSIGGVEPGQLVPDYCACKAAVINLSKHLANALAGDGILVNAVCPGQVNTDDRQQLAEYMASVEGISLEEAFQLIDEQGAARIPLGRLGEPADVAEVVQFLASDRAAWVTGACLHVNGGKTRSAF